MTVHRHEYGQWPFHPDAPYNSEIDLIRIVSFWDMLQIETRELFSAVTFISATVGQYKTFLNLAHLSLSTTHVTRSSLDNRAQLLNAIQILARSCSQFGFHSTADFAQSAERRCLDLLAYPDQLRATQIQTLLSALEPLPQSFVIEATSRKFYAMSAETHQFVKDADDLLGQSVVDAFPGTKFDVEEAGKCLGYSLWTAAVMHTMRMLEIGLQALAEHVQVVPQANWNTTLNLIEKKLREVSKKVDGEDAEQWAAETGTHLRFVKNAWRNQAMHPNTTYDQQRAIDIFDNARSFMQQLARQVSE